jgi:hypothetical protein
MRMYISLSLSHSLFAPVLAIRRERDSVREELENVLKDSRREREILQESLQSGSPIRLVVFFHLSLFRPPKCKNLVQQNGNSTQQNENWMLSRRVTMT